MVNTHPYRARREASTLAPACLALAATYTADLPAFAELLRTLDGDLAVFVARLRAAAGSDDPPAALLAGVP